MSENNWFERRPLRLEAEKIIMAQKYPQFVLKMDQMGRLVWEGFLETNFGILYLVNVLYPEAYPWEEPQPRIIEPNIRRDAPHRYPDGRLCVHPEDANPKQYTAAEMVSMIIRWLALYEIFLRTGERW